MTDGKIGHRTLAAAQAAGLTLIDVRTLLHIAGHEPVRQGAVAERIGISAGTMVAVADRLTPYARRTKHPNDRRQHLLILTEAGEDILRADADPLIEALGSSPSEPF